MGRQEGKWQTMDLHLSERPVFRRVFSFSCLFPARNQFEKEDDEHAAAQVFDGH
jgi:hypothetical protein